MSGLSKNECIREIFRDLAAPSDLHLSDALLAQAVDPDPVFLRIGQAFDALAELLQAIVLEPAFKDRVLHPLAEVLQGVSEAGPAAVAGYIIRNYDQHGNRKGS